MRGLCIELMLIPFLKERIIPAASKKLFTSMIVSSWSSPLSGPKSTARYSTFFRVSFAFNGLTNTSRAGTSHPIVYGEIVTGSVVISAGIDTNQVQA